MSIPRENITLSVIAPAFNEEHCLPVLVESISEVLEPLNMSFEIILVNDASTDGTPEVIENLCDRDARIRAVHHKINCGQSAAIASGMRAANGSLLVTLDADMQNPPSEIPVLLKNLSPDVDAVCGVRSKRNDPAIRKISSKTANSFRNWITGVPVTDAGCGMRLIRKNATVELPVFNGLHRFLTTVLKLQGFTVKETPISHAARLAGSSKYGINNRLWRGIYDCFAMRWYARRVIPAKRLG